MMPRPRIRSQPERSLDAARRGRRHVVAGAVVTAGLVALAAVVLRQPQQSVSERADTGWSAAGTPLLGGLTYAATARIGTTTYFVGGTGATPDNATVHSGAAYDATAAAWHRTAAPPFAAGLQNAVAVAAGDALVVVGMPCLSARDSEVTCDPAPLVAGVYRPGADSWRPAAVPPVQTDQLTGLGVWRGEAYFAAGVDPAASAGTVLFAYAVGSDRWRVVATTAAVESDALCGTPAAAVVVTSRFRRDGIVYPTNPNGPDAFSTDVTYTAPRLRIFDYGVQKWQDSPELPGADAYLPYATSCADQSVYLVAPSREGARVFRYDLLTHAWAALPPPLYPIDTVSSSLRASLGPDLVLWANRNRQSQRYNATVGSWQELAAPPLSPPGGSRQIPVSPTSMLILVPPVGAADGAADVRRFEPTGKQR